MKIVDIKVNWMEGFANKPFLEVLVDEIPSYDEILHQEIRFLKSAVYYYQKDGFVSFFVNPRSGGACGGKVVSKDGSVLHLSGAWSSRAGAMNKIGLGPIVDVSITDDSKVFANGGVFCSSHLTLASIQKWMDENKIDWWLVNIDNDGEPIWIPEDVDHKFV